MLALDTLQDLRVVAVVVIFRAAFEGFVVASNGVSVLGLALGTRACLARAALLTALQFLDSLLTFPLFAELVDQLLAVDGAVGHGLDLVEVVGFAEHVEQLLDVELEVVDAVVVVLAHAAHLVLQALRRSSGSPESLLELGNLRLQTSNKALVSSSNLVLEISFLALHTRELGSDFASFGLRVLQLLLIEEAAEDMRDRLAERARPVLVELGRVVHDDILNQLIDELVHSVLLLALLLDQQHVAHSVDKVGSGNGSIGFAQNSMDDLIRRVESLNGLRVLLGGQLTKVRGVLLLVILDRLGDVGVLPLLEQTEHLWQLGEIQLVTDRHASAGVARRCETRREQDHGKLCVSCWPRA